MARASTDICGNVNSAQDIRDINRQIRGEMRGVRGRDQLWDLEGREEGRPKDNYTGKQAGEEARLGCRL